MLVSNVKFAEELRVPPLKIKLSASADPGVAPKLSLEEIEIVPADKVVEPVYVFEPESVKIPKPALANEPVPEITPETVSSP